MTARIFAPITNRFRRKAEGRKRLVENDLGLLLQEDFLQEPIEDNHTLLEETEQTLETGHRNSLSSHTRDNHAVKHLEDSDSGGFKITTRERAPAKKRLRAFVGIILALTSAFFFTSGALMVKLAESVSSVQVSFMRLTIQLTCILPTMIFYKDNFIFPWSKTKFLVLRGTVGVTTMTMSIYAIKHMPLADARVIFYTSPVHTAIIARIFLKESVSKFDVAAMILSIGGVVLIARPTFLFGSQGEHSTSIQAWIPTLLAVLAALGAAVTATVTRKMSQEVGIRVVIFYFFLIGSVLTLALSMALGFKYPDCGSYDTIYIIVAAFCGFCGQLLATKALSMEKASVVSLVRTIGIAYSFIFQITILNDAPSGLSIGGAILVLLCNVCIFLKKFLDVKKTHAEFPKQEENTEHQ